MAPAAGTFPRRLPCQHFPVLRYDACGEIALVHFDIKVNKPLRIDSSLEFFGAVSGGEVPWPKQSVLFSV